VGNPISFETLNRENNELSYDAIKAHIQDVYQKLKEKLEQEKNNSSSVTQ